MHVVLEVDAPVHEAAQTYETNGVVPCNGVINHVTESSAGLACAMALTVRTPTFRIGFVLPPIPLRIIEGKPCSLHGRMSERCWECAMLTSAHVSSLAVVRCRNLLTLRLGFEVPFPPDITRRIAWYTVGLCFNRD